MATGAGLINAEGHANSEAFDALVLACSPEVREVVRDLVYEVLPQTVEVVWPRQGSVGWGTGPKKFTEQFAYLMPATWHVTLGFYRGGELPDPEGLLPGGGGTQVGGTLSMRSLKLRSVDEVRTPALRSLIEAATRQGIPPAGSGQS